MSRTDAPHRSLDQCSSWFLLTIFPSPPRANVRSLLMIQHCTLPISPAYQAVHVLVLISTQQPHGLKDGACSLAPPRASISQLEGQRNRAHLCEWTGSPSPRSGHINTLGWYLTSHWHGMTTFPVYTARARGCWESCGVLMVTFPRCAWKESTKGCNSISYGIRMRCVEWRIHKVPSTPARFFRQTTRTDAPSTEE